ncbi:uncharacterized protein LOC136036564 [Artemia franciscana]|uniref:Uncharacterized protein n=1 Tax=Artemia franciscana TaxID=6661 RepID=A0AA88I660_ARTSF|nr:hypothetical protein QYM36_004752 [Artemia franciscana]
MATIRELQHALAVRTEELREYDAVVKRLKKQIVDKENLISQLRNELDKYRQVLRSPTLATKFQHVGIEENGLRINPDAPWRKTNGVLNGEGRVKRQAISAEPLSMTMLNDIREVGIKKVTKSQR